MSPDLGAGSCVLSQPLAGIGNRFENGPDVSIILDRREGDRRTGQGTYVGVNRRGRVDRRRVDIDMSFMKLRCRCSASYRSSRVRATTKMSTYPPHKSGALRSTVVVKLRGRGSRQNLEGWLRRKTAPATAALKAHASTATAPTETTRVAAAQVTCHHHSSPDCHPSSFVSRSACSSQYVIPMSRYIEIAVVRCSCASSRLPMRR